MPSITATSDVVKAQVRLDVDVSDIDAPYVLVNRVNPINGASTQVRGHGSSVTVGGVAYAPSQAGYKAVLYDTEAPLDSAVYYTLTAPSATLNVDPDFSGGYTDPWTVSSQLITMRITSNTSGKNYLSFFTDGTVADPQLQAEDIPCTAGATITSTVTLSSTVSKQYSIKLIFRDASGAILSTATTTTGSVLAETTVTVSAAAPANTVSVQPAITMTGTPGATTTGNIASVYVTNNAGTAISGGASLNSDNACQLKDPLRPGNNVRVDFLFDPNPLCIPGEGVFWQSLDVESYAANSAVFNINNQPEALVVSKVRSAATSTLTLVSRTFADRDRLLTLLAPGSPLLFQAPDEYGLPDRYISVSADTVSRVLPDHRIPIRVFSLPHAVCAAPGGPMQGTVGARWQDGCNRYASWAAVTAAGLTWTQILDGAAG